MAYILKLECIGDNIRAQSRFVTNIINEIYDGLGDVVVGRPPSGPWVAEIDGKHPKYRWERRFLDGRKDYSEANSIVSRGVYLYYILAPGHIYEVNDLVSWQSRQRYFCRVDDNGALNHLTLENLNWIFPQE